LTTFGEWEFTCDAQATADAYAREEVGGSDTCTCSTCRNFRLVRDRAYPLAFIELLTSLGIDPTKDGEVYHNGEIEPRKHHYAGWFHFVGSLQKTGDFPMVRMGLRFTVSLCRKGAPDLKSLEGLSLVEVNFQAEGVPWVLPKKSPT
jgi:hypothetical protein